MESEDIGPREYRVLKYRVLRILTEQYWACECKNEIQILGI